ncbi:MAG: hypothetical protein D6753_04245 [Planctomycetota bacterium]|nr:MAG: hypothetical protein D6753_04245 [Planctomycetota bacterium]
MGVAKGWREWGDEFRERSFVVHDMPPWHAEGLGIWFPPPIVVRKATESMAGTDRQRIGRQWLACCLVCWIGWLGGSPGSGMWPWGEAAAHAQGVDSSSGNSDALTAGEPPANAAASEASRGQSPDQDAEPEDSEVEPEGDEEPEEVESEQLNEEPGTSADGQAAAESASSTEDAAEEDAAGEDAVGEDAGDEEEPGAHEGSEDDESGEAGRGADTSADGRFPSVDEFQFRSPPIEFDSPAPVLLPIDWPIGLAKVLGSLILCMIWLRCMELRSVDVASRGLSSEKWDWLLFVSGVVAIFLILFVPAVVVAIPLSIATLLVPFRQYKAWRNASEAGRGDPIGWVDLLHLPFGNRTPIDFQELRSPLQSKIDGAPATTPVLVDERGAARGVPEHHGSALELLLSIIDRCVADRATDIHINTKTNRVEVRQRVDGQLRHMLDLSLSEGRALINVVRVLSNLKLTDHHQAQDGRFRAERHGRRLCFRVSSQSTASGEKLSIRILDPSVTFADFAALGMPERIQQRLSTLLNRHHGLVLIVGASGAGKSTTAYAAINRLNTGELNIVSIEDPIEYHIPEIDQIEVNAARGQTFAAALRSALRLDADVIFVGEIRDEESAKIAVQAAASGQLVIATMHAADSVSAILRLTDLCGDRHLVASTLKAVVAQALVRLACPVCMAAKVKAQVPDVEPSSDIQPAYAEDDSVAPDPECPHCNGRGYFRRTGVFEFLEVDSKIQQMVHANETPSEIEAYAKQQGLRKLDEEALQMYREGRITREELYRQFELTDL